jgi:phenylacetate-CoA ligase
VIDPLITAAALPYALASAFAGEPTDPEWRSLRGVRRIAAHAYQRVPFYRERWRTAAFSPDSIATLDDFARAPLIEREDWRAAPDEAIVTRGVGPLVWHWSGGTSGEPFRCPMRLRDELVMRGQALRGVLGSGGRLLRLNPPDVRKPGGRAYLGRLINVASAASTRQRLDAVLADSCPALASYPGILWQVAVMALRESVTLPGGVERISVGGEVLTPTMQRTIERVFQTPVWQNYAAADLGLMARGCEAGHLHVRPRYSYLEVVDGGKPAEPGRWGEVVVTNFLSYARPAIRLRTGDRAMWGSEPCPCGSRLPYLRYIAGRLPERIERPDGSYVTWPDIEAALADTPGVLGYQAEQTAQGAVTVRLCLDDPRGPADPYLPALTALFGGMEVAVAVTDDFRPAPSGKLSPIIGYGG